jgi:hypothetical protein
VPLSECKFIINIIKNRLFKQRKYLNQLIKTNTFIENFVNAHDLKKKHFLCDFK